jgi:hypothetical protein
VESTLVAAAVGGVGFLVGSSFTYFSGRRDSWLKARASGLIMLAAIQDALCLANRRDNQGIATSIALWEKHREVLAGFRRGRYPSGLTSTQWLEVAAEFSLLAHPDPALAEEALPMWRVEVLRGIAKPFQDFASRGPVALYVTAPRVARWRQARQQAIQ